MTPVKVTGLVPSYSAPNEWWATAGTRAENRQIPVRHARAIESAAGLSFISSPVGQSSPAQVSAACYTGWGWLERFSSKHDGFRRRLSQQVEFGRRQACEKDVTEVASR